MLSVGAGGRVPVSAWLTDGRLAGPRLGVSWPRLRAAEIAAGATRSSSPPELLTISLTVAGGAAVVDGAGGGWPAGSWTDGRRAADARTRSVAGSEAAGDCGAGEAVDLCAAGSTAADGTPSDGAAADSAAVDSAAADRADAFTSASGEPEVEVFESGAPGCPEPGTGGCAGTRTAEGRAPENWSSENMAALPSRRSPAGRSADDTSGSAATDPVPDCGFASLGIRQGSPGIRGGRPCGTAPCPALPELLPTGSGDGR